MSDTHLSLPKVLMADGGISIKPYQLIIQKDKEQLVIFRSITANLVTRALINISTLDFTIIRYVPAIAVVHAQFSRKLQFEHQGFHILIVEFYFAFRSRTNGFKLKKTLKTTERYVRYSHSYEMSGLDKAGQCNLTSMSCMHALVDF